MIILYAFSQSHDTERTGCHPQRWRWRRWKYGYVPGWAGLRTKSHLHRQHLLQVRSRPVPQAIATQILLVTCIDWKIDSFNASPYCCRSLTDAGILAQLYSHTLRDEPDPQLFGSIHRRCNERSTRTLWSSSAISSLACYILVHAKSRWHLPSQPILTFKSTRDGFMAWSWHSTHTNRSRSRSKLQTILSQR